MSATIPQVPANMLLRVTLSFLALAAVTGLASIYLSRRVRELWPMRDSRARAVAWTIFLSGLLPIVRFLGPADAWLGIVATIGFAIALTAAFAMALLVLVDLVDLIARRVRPAPPPKADAPTPRVGRREMIRRTAIGSSLAAAAATSGYAFSLGRTDYVLEEHAFRLARLPRALDGYAIAQLSDVHLGTFVGRRETAAARDLVRRARADLVVLTGDLVDHDPRYLADLGVLVRAMADMGPRDGIVAILGNHDDYTGADAVTETLRAAGVRVLRNDAMTIGDAGGRFALLGVDDLYALRNGYGVGPDLRAAIAAAPPDVGRVLLCHNPRFFTEASSQIDLQLSGHTHGGQLNPIVTPAELVMDYVAGRYVRGDAQLYVNRGFGTAGPPARLGSAPEVTRIVLTAG